jgi:hypothetical protein
MHAHSRGAASSSARPGAYSSLSKVMGKERMRRPVVAGGDVQNRDFRLAGDLGVVGG